MLLARGGNDYGVEYGIRCGCCGDHDGVAFLYDNRLTGDGGIAVEKSTGQCEQTNGEDGADGNVVFVAGECCFHVYLLGVGGGVALLMTEL